MAALPGVEELNIGHALIARPVSKLGNNLVFALIAIDAALRDDRRARQQRVQALLLKLPATPGRYFAGDDAGHMASARFFATEARVCGRCQKRQRSPRDGCQESSP